LLGSEVEYALTDVNVPHSGVGVGVRLGVEIGGRVRVGRGVVVGVRLGVGIRGCVLVGRGVMVGRDIMVGNDVAGA